MCEDPHVVSSVVVALDEDLIANEIWQYHPSR
jgi:hypothetical protein